MSRDVHNTVVVTRGLVTLVATLLVALLVLVAPAYAYGSTGEGATISHVYAQDGDGIMRVFTVLEGSGTDGSAEVVAYLDGPHDPVWVVEMRSGMADEGGKLLDSKIVNDTSELVSRDGRLFYMPAETIEADGTTYHRVQEEIEVSENGGAIEAYYVVDGYELTGDYEVALQFVDIADGASIGTQNESVSLESAKQGVDEVIGVPTSLQDGAYVLVPGQFFDLTNEGAAALFHNYYAPDRAYTIYYRKADDVDYADAVITRIKTVRSASHLAVGGESIVDETNPLAAPFMARDVDAPSPRLGSLQMKSTMFGGILGGLLVLGIVLFVYLIGRKKEEDGEDFADDM